MTTFYRTGWISDVHLGTRGCQAEALLQFLKTHEFETLYIVGDLIDVWALKRGLYWPQAHNDVIQKILRAGRKGTRVIYIPGNHDEFLAGFHGDYGAVSVVPKAIHETADGRRLLIMHGHEMDIIVQNRKWMALIGDIGYSFLLRLNAPLNWVRSLLGLGFWSLSAAAKRSVKNAVNYIGAFEDAILRLAEMEGVDGIVCGHIHTPVIRSMGSLQYLNSGDWVESLSGLVEHFDGRIEIVRAEGAHLARGAESPAAGAEALHAGVGVEEWAPAAKGQVPSGAREPLFEPLHTGSPEVCSGDAL